MPRQTPSARAKTRVMSNNLSGASPSQLDTNYRSTNVIQPNAHPEMETVKPGLKNPIDVIKGLLKRKKKT